MSTVGAYAAKTHLSELLKRVAKGEKITITRHGVPIAVLQPPDSEAKPPVDDVIDELRGFRRKHLLGGISIREMIEEGRR